MRRAYLAKGDHSAYVNILSVFVVFPGNRTMVTIGTGEKCQFPEDICYRTECCAEQTFGPCKIA